MKLETERLLLRPIEQSDMEQLLSLLKNDVIKQTYMIPDFPSEESAVPCQAVYRSFSGRREACRGHRA